MHPGSMQMGGGQPNMQMGGQMMYNPMGGQMGPGSMSPGAMAPRPPQQQGMPGQMRPGMPGGPLSGASMEGTMQSKAAMAKNMAPAGNSLPPGPLNLTPIAMPKPLTFSLGADPASQPGGMMPPGPLNLAPMGAMGLPGKAGFSKGGGGPPGAPMGMPTGVPGMPTGPLAVPPGFPGGPLAGVPGGPLAGPGAPGPLPGVQVDHWRAHRQSRAPLQIQRDLDPKVLHQPRAMLLLLLRLRPSLLGEERRRLHLRPKAALLALSHRKRMLPL